MACAPPTPYCSVDTFTCVQNIDRCIVKTGSTYCSQEFTSDLTDCRKYTLCIGDGYYYQYYCDQNFAFDPKTNSCVFRGTCNNFSNTTLCAGRANQLVPYPGNPNWFVFCGNPPSLYSCAVNYIFNLGLQSCVFQCPSQGRFPNIGDSTNSTWYNCIAFFGDIRPIQSICPSGTTFDPYVGIGPDTGTCLF